MNITLALQRAVRNFPLGAEALAASMRMSESSLHHKVSPTHPGAHCSPEEMLEVMERTGDDGPLQAMAACRSYVLLPTPREGDDDGETAQAMVDTIKEFSDFMGACSTDLADGAVTQTELARMQREGAEAMAAIQRLLRHAAQLHAAALPAHLRAVP